MADIVQAVQPRRFYFRAVVSDVLFQVDRLVKLANNGTTVTSSFNTILVATRCISMKTINISDRWHTGCHRNSSSRHSGSTHGLVERSFAIEHHFCHIS